MAHKQTLYRRYASRATSVGIALLMMVSVGYIGLRNYSESKAAALRQIAVSPATATWSQGSTVTVSIRENSGTTAITQAQFNLTYNTSQLQYAGYSETGEFDYNPSSWTCTPSGSGCISQAGTIRITRGTKPTEPGVTGEHGIVNLNFKVLTGSGTTTLNISNYPYSKLTDKYGMNILSSVASGTFTLMPVLVLDANLSLLPSSGSFTNGATIPVVIRLHSPTQRAYSVHTVLTYPASALQYVSTTASSAFPTVTNLTTTAGALDMTRKIGTGAQGVLGDADVATITFKVVGSSGNAALSIARTAGANDSGVFDSGGRNLLGSVNGATYTINTAGGGGTIPPSSPPPLPGGGSVPTSPPAVYSGTTSYSSAGGGHVSLSGDSAQVEGSVKLTPVPDPVVLEKNANDSIGKVEYWLNGKLLATQKSAPFTYTFDTKKLRNGTYDLTIKTYYTSGTVDSSVQKVQVKNPVNLSYVMVHYKAGLIGSLAGLVIIVFLIWRFVWPHLTRKSAPALAMDAPPGYPGYGNPPVVTPESASQADPSSVQNQGSVADDTGQTVQQPAVAAADPAVAQYAQAVPAAMPNDVTMPQSAVAGDQASQIPADPAYLAAYAQAAELQAAQQAYAAQGNQQYAAPQAAEQANVPAQADPTGQVYPSAQQSAAPFDPEREPDIWEAAGQQQPPQPPAPQPPQQYPPAPTPPAA